MKNYTIISFSIQYNRHSFLLHFAYLYSMEEKLKKKIDELWQQAKKAGKNDIKVTLASGGETSLGKVIKTKEQADLFMKLLNSL